MVKTEKRNLGDEGEDFAYAYLKKKYWKILSRNISEKFGELDIIARDTDGILVFIEVKTMRGYFPGGVQPEDQMTRSKILKFKKMALSYANSHKDLWSDKTGFRLDVIALIKVGNDFIVHHYENI
ncbi:MAG: YraN family protein [Elusimicrobiota bacterium]